MLKNFKKNLNFLKDNLNDQNKFNQKISEIISELNIDDKEFSEDREESDKKLKNPESQESKDKADGQIAEKRMNKNFQLIQDLLIQKIYQVKMIKVLRKLKKLEKRQILDQKEYFLQKGKKYKIYTDQFDEVIKAENLETKEELRKTSINIRSTTFTAEKFCI